MASRSAAFFCKFAVCPNIPTRPEHPDDNNLPSVPFAVLLILTYEKDPLCECDFLENRWPLQEICEKERIIRCMLKSLPFKVKLSKEMFYVQLYPEFKYISFYFYNFQR